MAATTPCTGRPAAITASTAAGVSRAEATATAAPFERRKGGCARAGNDLLTAGLGPSHLPRRHGAAVPARADAATRLPRSGNRVGRAGTTEPCDRYLHVQDVLKRPEGRPSAKKGEAVRSPMAASGGHLLGRDELSNSRASHSHEVRPTPATRVSDGPRPVRVLYKWRLLLAHFCFAPMQKHGHRLRPARIGAGS